jgi:hypothetical protein
MKIPFSMEGNQRCTRFEFKKGVNNIQTVNNKKSTVDTTSRITPVVFDMQTVGHRTCVSRSAFVTRVVCGRETEEIIID